MGVEHCIVGIRCNMIFVSACLVILPKLEPVGSLACDGINNTRSVRKFAVNADALPGPQRGVPDEACGRARQRIVAPVRITSRICMKILLKVGIGDSGVRPLMAVS